MLVYLDFRHPTTYNLSFPSLFSFFFFLLSFCLGALSSVFSFFLSFSLLRFVCLKKVVKYRIFGEVGEDSEICLEVR